MLVGNIATRVQTGMTLAVAVGNEPWHHGVDPAVLVAAYTNLRSAVAGAGLAGSVKLTVPFAESILGVSYPPTQGAFAANKVATLQQLATMMRDDGASFTVNLYPFITMVAQRAAEYPIGLDYALGNTGHDAWDHQLQQASHYTGLLDASRAAMRAALLRLDAGFTAAALPIVIGETGWPTAGDAEATPANAATFARYAAASGFEMYLFEAFDEQLKTSQPLTTAPYEDHFGLFNEDATLKYTVPALQQLQQ